MSNAQPTDEQLVTAILTGDRDRFGVLVDRYAGMANSLALAAVQNPEDACDIVQQALFTAYARLGTLQEPRRFGGWLRGIVANLARRTLERREREQRLLERCCASGVAPDPATVFSQGEDVGEALRALGSLAPDHRDVAVLYYLRQMPVSGVASIVGRPVGTVKRMLSEARATLRMELMEMTRDEMDRHGLTDEQRGRLELIPRFPQFEPDIRTMRLATSASTLRIVSPHGNFPRLEAGAEACFADYDYPDRALTHITHSRVLGPVQVGRPPMPALAVDGISFTGEGTVDGGWRPYFRVEGDEVTYCGRQVSPPGKPGPLLTPSDALWDEAQPKPALLILQPGTVVEPTGDWHGHIIDENLWAVSVGKRTFECVRRCGGGERVEVTWADDPVTQCATEEFFLPDGRLLLWRRYNGMKWSAQDPKREPDKAGTYEMLRDAGVPRLDVFGEVYYLWYDQVPDYALG